MAVAFGDFAFDPERRQLLRLGEPVPLETKAYELLGLLLSRRPNALSKAQIRDVLWPGTFVSESALARLVAQIRAACGDDPQNSRFIRTVHGFGYAFCGEAEEVRDASRAIVPPGRLENRAEDRFQPARDVAFDPEAIRGVDSAISGPSRRARLARAARLTPVVWTAIAGALAFVLFATWRLRPWPTPEIVGSTQLTFTGDVGALEMYGAALPAILTDGARIYFLDVSDMSGERLGVASVSKAGGEVVVLPTPFKNTIPVALSPDGDRLLVRAPNEMEPDAPLWIMPTSGGAPRRLGNVVAQDATWSPDGKSLVYARGEELHLADSDGGRPQKLVHTNGRPCWIRFSLDGRRLRFTLTNTSGSRRSLWEVSVDGTDLHALPLQWNEPAQACCGEWSRDGRYFLFTAWQDEGADLWLVDETSAFRGERGKPKRLTSIGFDSVAAIPSADGKKLFAVEARGGLQMFKYDPRSRRMTPFPFRSVRRVKFSADGQWLAYVEFQGRKQALMRSRTDGSQVLQLSTPPMEPWSAHWSPDGRQIAFAARLPGGPYKAYVVSREGGAPRQVFPDERSEIDLDWSGDGQSLMFGRPPDSMGGEDEKRAVHVVNLKSNQVATLPGSEGLFSSRWSPDGRQVVALPLNQKKLVIFDFETAHWRDLAGPGIGTGLAGACVPFCHNPVWSLDGRYVYFESGPNVLRVVVADRRVERVVGVDDLPNVNGSFDGLTPDGSVLLATFPRSSNIYALDWRVP